MIKVLLLFVFVAHLRNVEDDFGLQELQKTQLQPRIALLNDTFEER